MIKADKKIWAELLFNRYSEILLKRHYSAFYITGEIPTLSKGRSLLITPNHFSWWDGFFIYYAAAKLFRKDFFILMLDAQLKNYPFFRKIGAFSIEPASLRSIKEALGYASVLLSRPESLLVFYPQGQIEPFDKRPLTIRNGLFKLLKENNHIDILPAAFRIEYSNLKKPSVYLRFGPLMDNDNINRDPALFKDTFTENLECLNRSIVSGSYSPDLFRRGL